MKKRLSVLLILTLLSIFQFSCIKNEKRKTRKEKLTPILKHAGMNQNEMESVFNHYIERKKHMKPFHETSIKTGRAFEDLFNKSEISDEVLEKAWEKREAARINHGRELFKQRMKFKKLFTSKQWSEYMQELYRIREETR